MRWRSGEERAQATVEMAVVTPLLIVLALIVYNLMLYVSATARFDRVASDIVLAHGVAPSGDAASDDEVAARIADELEQAMEGLGVEIEVVMDQGPPPGRESLLTLVGPLRTYYCTMRMKPWPGDFTIAGVRMGAPSLLQHTQTVTIDPWHPGVVM